MYFPFVLFVAVFCLPHILEPKSLSKSIRESGMCEILRTVKWQTKIMSTWQMTRVLNTSVILAEPHERSRPFKRAFLTYISVWGQNSWKQKKKYWLKLAEIWKLFLGNWTEWWVLSSVELITAKSNSFIVDAELNRINTELTRAEWQHDCLQESC